MSNNKLTGYIAINHEPNRDYYILVMKQLEAFMDKHDICRIDMLRVPIKEKGQLEQEQN